MGRHPQEFSELCHDDKIYIIEQRSTYSLDSLTDKGVQTGDTFADFLRFTRTCRSTRATSLYLLQGTNPSSCPLCS